MRISNLFTKTSKNVPAGEIAKNAQLLIRAGYISKVMSGVYVYAPLGLMVLEKIKQIVREEMNSVGGQELIMSTLQKKETWDVTGRWDDKVVDMWFKSKLQDGNEVGFAWSHEEAIIEMLKEFVVSYKDLPVNVYQFQTKFRNELRSKSGIMRGREFLMKDMYSCSIDEKQHNQFYNDTIEAYNRVFERLGLKDDTYMTFASGGAFTQFSHEFQTVCEAGEDTIYLHKEKNIAINEDVMDDENLNKLGINRDELEKVKTAEVGNIFNFGTKKSEDTNFTFTNKEGNKQLVYFGSYGIGITRLMGVIVEKFSDDKGLVWPENIAPFKIYLLRIGGDQATGHTNDLYREFTEKGFEVLYDDRDIHPGQKFADSELLGIPYRVTVSDRMLENDQYELVERKNGQKSLLTREQLLAKLG